MERDAGGRQGRDRDSRDLRQLSKDRHLLNLADGQADHFSHRRRSYLISHQFASLTYLRFLRLLQAQLDQAPDSFGFGLHPVGEPVIINFRQKLIWEGNQLPGQSVRVDYHKSDITISGYI